VKTRLVTLYLAGVVALLLAVGNQADVIPTNEWVSFKGNVTFNGQPAPIGSVIDAYDPDGVHCGTWTVGVTDTTDPAGIYGFMPVYADDQYEPGDQGAEAGDTIFFKVNGRDAAANGNVVWWHSGDVYTVDLSATGTVAVTGVDFPSDTIGLPDDTIRFLVGVLNEGDGLDFYGVTSSSAKGWPTVNKDTLTYADSAETVYVYFDIIIPTFPGDTTDTITFSVFSYLDTSQHVDSNVQLITSLTDVGDEPFVEMPDGFYLHQNYPNPFNPTTTISFTLSSRTSARLEVFDLLGRQVGIRDLGFLRSGDHSIEYDASGLPSGVYFYRLETETNSQTRKMILLK
jgi:hypothetical protein